MTEFEVHSPPAGTVSLAAYMARQIVELGTDPDTAMANARNVAPAVILGCAAIDLTGESDLRKAVEQLFANRELQSEVIAALADPAVSPEILLTEAKRKRLAALRNEADTTGAIELKNLLKGEEITLVYEHSGRKRTLSAALTVRRTLSGDEDISLALEVVAASGEQLGPWLAKFRPGSEIFLGYMQPETEGHIPELRLGRTFSWATGIHKHGDDWVYGDVKFEPGFTLQQVYYGTGDNFPIMSSRHAPAAAS